jgi:hypothetical protein
MTPPEIATIEHLGDIIFHSEHLTLGLDGSHARA